MTTIFVVHAQEDAGPVELLRQALEVEGYAVWCKPQTLQLTDLLYPRTPEDHLLGSAGMILIWSRSAAQSQEVGHQIRFAQRLKKVVVAVSLETIDLPAGCIAVSSLFDQQSCHEIITHLPSLQSTDAFQLLCEQAAHPLFRTRKEAIAQAAQMLQRGEHQEEVLVLLEYLASSDPMMGVREQAQDVLPVR